VLYRSKLPPHVHNTSAFQAPVASAKQHICSLAYLIHELTRATGPAEVRQRGPRGARLARMVPRRQDLRRLRARGFLGMIRSIAAGLTLTGSAFLAEVVRVFLAA
jgi:hypothetical protein